MQYRQAIATPYDIAAGVMMGTLILMSLFYSAEALHGERRMLRDLEGVMKEVGALMGDPKRTRARAQAGLEALRKTSDGLAKLLASACPATMPATPIDRLDAADRRLNSMLYAVVTLRAPLDAMSDSPQSQPDMRVMAGRRRRRPARRSRTRRRPRWRRTARRARPSVPGCA